MKKEGIMQQGVPHTAVRFGRLSDFGESIDPITRQRVHNIRYPVGILGPDGSLDARQPVYNAPELMRWLRRRSTLPHSNEQVDLDHLRRKIDAVHWMSGLQTMGPTNPRLARDTAQTEAMLRNFAVEMRQRGTLVSESESSMVDDVGVEGESDVVENDNDMSEGEADDNDMSEGEGDDHDMSEEEEEIPALVPDPFWIADPRPEPHHNGAPLAAWFNNDTDSLHHHSAEMEDDFGEDIQQTQTYIFFRNQMSENTRIPIDHMPHLHVPFWIVNYWHHHPYSQEDRQKSIKEPNSEFLNNPVSHLKTKMHPINSYWHMFRLNMAKYLRFSKEDIHYSAPLLNYWCVHPISKDHDHPITIKKYFHFMNSAVTQYHAEDTELIRMVNQQMDDFGMAVR